MELLIVLSILGILASFLLPILRGATKKVREIQCVTQLKQIGHALRMYEQDHDDRLPPFLANTHPAYLSDLRTFICREDRFQGKADPAIYWVSPWTSYFYLPDVKYGVGYFFRNNPSWAGGWHAYAEREGSSQAKLVSDSWHYFPQRTLRLYADGHVKTSR